MLEESSLVAARHVADNLGAKAAPVLAHLATEIRLGSKSFPYSVVAAIEDSSIPAGGAILNQWAAQQLTAKVGDPVRMEYFEVQPSGRLATRTVTFKVASISPMTGSLMDRHFVPTYPGITDAKNFGRGRRRSRSTKRFASRMKITGEVPHHAQDVAD